MAAFARCYWMLVLARALLLSHHYVSVNYYWVLACEAFTQHLDARDQTHVFGSWVESWFYFPRPSAGPLETRYALPGSDSRAQGGEMLN